MGVDRTSLLFFDASCLFAAARSSKGGSAFLLKLCAAGYLRGAVSTPVVMEATRNLGNEPATLPDSSLVQLIDDSISVWANVPERVSDVTGTCTVNDKDWHVAAAAVGCEASYLISLDRPLIEEVNRLSATVAVTPGDFIQGELLSHPEFEHLRK